jgi:SlyX protein
MNMADRTEDRIEDRLIEIEIKLSRQEDLVESLNQVVYQQQRKIAQLEAMYAALALHVKQTPDAEGVRNVGYEKPPHY